MALAMSQPPETQPSRLGEAAQNPAVLQSLQEQLSNATVGGQMNQRLGRVEEELQTMKQTVETLKGDPQRAVRKMQEELKDLRVLMSEHNSAMQQMAKELKKNMKKMYDGQDIDFGDVETGGDDREPRTMGKRVSWNEMRRDEHLDHESSLKVSSNIHQDGTGTDDLTVDRWGFKQSCWDSAAFIGDTNLLLPAEACANFLLLCVNVGVQACFTIIVLMSLVSSEVGEDVQRGYHLWRTNTGHTVQFMDRLTHESLASRVCRGDKSLYLSDTQSFHVEEINKYYYDNYPFNGPMMALLAMYVWCLTVSKEFHVLKDMTVALNNVPQGETVIIKQRDRLVLQEISCFRKSFIYVLAMIRISIGSTILIAGTMFLAVTIEIQELLLNAIALEFILNVDELLYHAMAPMKTRRFLVLLKPLPLRKSKSIKGLDTNMFVVMVLTSAFMVIVGTVWLQPELENMVATKDELCNGYLDFSYAPTVLGSPYWASPEDDIETSLDKYFKTSRYEILRTVIEYGDPSEYNITKISKKAAGHELRKLDGPGMSVYNVYTASVAMFSSLLNAACVDILDSPNMTIRHVAEASIADAVGNTSLLTCKSLAQYCNYFDAPGPMARAYCSVTCGCASPASTLALPKPELGCPDTCINTIGYNKIFQARKCEEEQVIVNNPIWRELITGYLIATKGWGSEPLKKVQFAAALMLKYGCYAISEVRKFGADLCEPPDLKPVRYLCPVSCECHIKMNDMCPPQCEFGLA